jgi:hypothetical protein
MIEFNNKILTIIINILLFPWLVTQWIPGLLFLAIFHNYELYRNEDAGVTVLKVNKGNLFGNACFSCGPIIFVTPNCDDDTIRHETGHSVQSLMLGPLFHFVVSLPSVVRFWIRRFKNKSHDWYLSGWPEGSCRFGAEELGHTKRYEYKNK